MDKFIYSTPALLDYGFASVSGEGESCYVDCNNDDICPDADDF